ncbi:PadR family transcriptional regulator [Enterococcus termitis]|uniref:PadR family transcriptional regulator n=2 Tax=Enterococcus termitis TaxID=332950 RepID=A0A1E5H1Z4_9ENTE|nr:PadR family transcriptional regulator [Enterococcus termitis]OJG96369.1 PadR family transcriptional regulator [Enterococcus termitis]
MDKLSEMLKGVLEGMMLQIISESEVYGYEIVRRLTAMGFSGMTEGTVYTILLRLERNKMVNITKKPSELGPPRKFYTLNDNGKQELADFWERWAFLSNRVMQLKSEGNTNHDNQF